MRFLCAFLAAATLGCASAPPPRPIPPLPPLADLGELVPAEEKRPPKGKLAKYPDTPIVRGDCKGLPAGILVSHANYYDFVEAMIERRRLQIESATLERLRNEEHALALKIEQAYRDRVAGLEKSLAAEERGTNWKYVATAITSGLIVLVTVHASRPLPR